MTKPDRITIECHLVQETPRAMLLAPAGNAVRREWVSKGDAKRGDLKAQYHIGNVYEFEIDRAVAIEKGLFVERDASTQDLFGGG